MRPSLQASDALNTLDSHQLNINIAGAFLEVDRKIDYMGDVFQLFSVDQGLSSFRR